jgi:hypothetical protein
MYDFDLRPAVIVLVLVGALAGCGVLLLAQWLWNHVSLVIR